MAFDLLGTVNGLGREIAFPSFSLAVKYVFISHRAYIFKMCFSGRSFKMHFVWSRDLSFIA